MEISEIDEFIVNDKSLNEVKNLKDKDIKDLRKKINNSNLSDDDNKIVENAKKYFGDDFFNLSKSGREGRIKTVETQNNKLKDIRDKMKKIVSNVKDPDERKKQLKEVRDSINDLAVGTKTSDIFKQALSKWEPGWNFYKKGVEERYNHPVIYTLKRIAIPAATALLGGWVLFASVGVISYFTLRASIAQYRKVDGYKPNLDGLKANFFTGKNSLKNALFRKKSYEKAISSVKEINIDKIANKTIVTPTGEPDKDKKKDTDKTSSKENSLDKLIETIRTFPIEDRSFENIETMRSLLIELDGRKRMGEKIPDDKDFMDRIEKMHKIVKKYDDLMAELDELCSKKDDKSLDNIKNMYKLVENIISELRSLPDENKKKFEEIARITEEFSEGIAKTINDAYAKLGDPSKENMEELSKFCDKINDYMFAIDDDTLKEKVKEIKARVAEYKKNKVHDDKISKLNELFDKLKDEEINNLTLEDIKGIVDRVDSVKDKLSKDSQNKYSKILARKSSLENPKKEDDKDAKRILFEKNRKSLSNPRVDSISIASIPKENINNLRSFVDSIRPYENELNSIERNNYERLVDMIKKWDKINTNREFLRSCNVTELNNLPNETLNWVAKRITELEEIKSDLTTDEKEKMDVISNAISGYLDKRKLFMECRENWRNISAYSNFEIEKKEQYERICEIVDAMKQFEKELTTEEKIKLNKYVDARDNYALIKKGNSDLNNIVRQINLDELRVLSKLNKREQDQTLNAMTYESVKRVQKEVEKIQKISTILDELCRKDLTDKIKINDMEKFQDIIDLEIVHIKKDNIPNLNENKKSTK